MGKEKNKGKIERNTKMSESMYVRGKEREMERRKIGR